MADEERKRRRGHRRGGSQEPGPSQQPEQPADADPGESALQPPLDAAPDGGSVTPPPSAKESSKKSDKPASGTHDVGAVSPMEFWRRGSARSARGTAVSQKKLGVWQRITGFHFPPWVPVVGIIAIVFAILGALFISRTATGAPRIGSDHWHATYTFTACGQKQPNAPFWEAGIHTHGDGIIHMHPFQPSEEGAGARLVKWFEYGGGKLTSNSIRMPGSSDEYKNGDKCDDGTEGTLQIFVTPASTGVEARLNNITRYGPKDGDRARIVFGPVETEPVVADDRTIIPEDQSTRTAEVVVTDGGGSAPEAEASTRFEPNRIAVDAGETVKLVVKNTGSISHGLRIRGVDAQYGTSDDFVVTPDGQDAAASSGILQPNSQGFAIMKFASAGEIEFRDETIQAKTGVIVVGKAPEVTASPTPAAGEVAVDVELDAVMKDNFFEPGSLSVPAGKKFRINLKNEGPTFAHNMRIAGPDAKFDTNDDLVSTPSAQRVGVDGELVGQIDEAGTYDVRCDFHTEMTGTVTVTAE